VLLSAKIAGDKGYFGEKLAAARQQIIRAWRDRSAHLQPNAPGTDILGSLVVAGQILQQAPADERKVLVLFSDMREFTRHLNFETQSTIPIDAALAKVDEGQLLSLLSHLNKYAERSIKMRAAENRRFPEMARPLESVKTESNWQVRIGSSWGGFNHGGIDEPCKIVSRLRRSPCVLASIEGPKAPVLRTL
jgi:hypothetical protein